MVVVYLDAKIVESLMHRIQRVTATSNITIYRIPNASVGLRAARIRWPQGTVVVVCGELEAEVDSVCRARLESVFEKIEDGDNTSDDTNCFRGHVEILGARSAQR